MAGRPAAAVLPSTCAGRRSDDSKTRAAAIELLTMLHDRRFPTGDKRRATVVRVLEDDAGPAVRHRSALRRARQPRSGVGSPGTRAIASRPRSPARSCSASTPRASRPRATTATRCFCARPTSSGWKRFIVYRLRGQRFHGVGSGRGHRRRAHRPLRLQRRLHRQRHGRPGVHIHGNAQDQVAQIAKRGKLVIYGDVGQTFMYGAKGGEVYVLGNGAGRPLINAVGRPAWSSTAPAWTSWPSRSWPAIR